MSSPKAPRANLLGFPWKPANVYLPEHNAPVVVRTQWHQGDITYGTNVPDFGEQTVADFDAIKDSRILNQEIFCSEHAFSSTQEQHKEY